MYGRLDRILELADITGDKSDPRFLHTIKRLMLRPDQRLEEFLLRKLTIKAGDRAIVQPPFKSIAAGDMDWVKGVPYVRWGHAAQLEHGTLIGADVFRFPLTAGHRLITGSTRSGKSCGVARMLEDLPREANVWLIDPENDRVYMNLALSAGFDVIDCAALKRNLFEAPAGCDPAVWDGRVKRNFRESFFLRDGSISMLTMLLDQCRQEKPVITLRDVYRKLIALRYRLTHATREFAFFESLKNRLEALLVNKMFECTTGHDLAALASRKVLFLCGSLSSEEFVLFCNDLMDWLGCYFQPDLNPVPRLVVVLEEVHRLTNPQRLRRADIAEPIVLDAVRTLAKRRVSLWCVDQVPSGLPTEILANVSFRAIFNTIEGRDLDALQRSLSLNAEQRTAISRLPQRACIVQYANPLFPEPFPVVVDEFALRADIDAELAERKAQTLAALHYVPLEAPTQPREPKADAPKRETTGPLVSADALDYLREIAKDQYVPVSKRDEHLGIPVAQGNLLREELIAAGLIARETVNTHSKSRRVVNSRITEAGYGILDALKVRCERPRGIGSWEHQWHQRAVAAWGVRNGFTARVEHMHDGKSVDVALEKGGLNVAAEILCEGVKKELNNLRDLHTGYDRMWFCLKDKSEARQLKQLIETQFGDESAAIFERTEFHLLAEFQDAQPVLG